MKKKNKIERKNVREAYIMNHNNNISWRKVLEIWNLEFLLREREKEKEKKREREREKKRERKKRERETLNKVCQLKQVYLFIAKDRRKGIPV